MWSKCNRSQCSVWRDREVRSVTHTQIPFLCGFFRSSDGEWGDFLDWIFLQGLGFMSENIEKKFYVIFGPQSMSNRLSSHLIPSQNTHKKLSENFSSGKFLNFKTKCREIFVAHWTLISFSQYYLTRQNLQFFICFPFKQNKESRVFSQIFFST